MHPYILQHEMNDLIVQRSSLTFGEAVAVWLMRFEKQKVHTIAARLGINSGRVADVLTFKKHEGSYKRAIELSRG